MTRSYFLQLNNTDNLETVIKKCNTNFGNFSLIANRSTSGTSADIDLTSLIDDIEAERLAREAADTDLDVSKAPLASPALTGTPTAPTAAAGTNTTQIATTEFVMTAIASAGGGGGGDLPIGTVIDFAGATIPLGYLECDGSAVSRTDYADLFAVLGTAWGTGDGSTTFNLPDLNGRVTIGATVNAIDGNSHVAHTDAAAHSVGGSGGDERMPSHSHGNTIKATTPKFTHSITQPVFALPNHRHGPYNSDGYNGILTHITDSSISQSAGFTKVTSGTREWVKYTNTGNPTSNPDCTRSTNVGVGDHAATDCTMSGSVSNSGSGSAGNMQPFATVRKIIRAI